MKPIVENPPWLTALLDQRLELLNRTVGSLLCPPQLVATSLTDPPEDTKTALDYWERSCDNCGTYCKPGDAFYSGHITRVLANGSQVAIAFGVCPVCKLTLEAK